VAPEDGHLEQLGGVVAQGVEGSFGLARHLPLPGQPGGEEHPADGPPLRADVTVLGEGRRALAVVAQGLGQLAPLRLDPPAGDGEVGAADLLAGADGLVVPGRRDRRRVVELAEADERVGLGRRQQPDGVEGEHLPGPGPRPGRGPPGEGVVDHLDPGPPPAGRRQGEGQRHRDLTVGP
jgi:hypothetical protein